MKRGLVRGGTVFVLGPESSGGRFVHRWLDSHPEVWAWHWSMPHGAPGDRRWPAEMWYHRHRDVHGDAEIDKRLDRGDTLLVVTQRMAEPMIASQLANHPVPSAEVAVSNIREGYDLIETWSRYHRQDLIGVEYVSYEAMVLYGERAMARVWERLGVDPVSPPEPIVDGNRKWLRIPEAHDPECVCSRCHPRYVVVDA